MVRDIYVWFASFVYFALIMSLFFDPMAFWGFVIGLFLIVFVCMAVYSCIDIVLSPVMDYIDLIIK